MLRGFVDITGQTEYNGRMAARDSNRLREFLAEVGRPLETGVALSVFSSFRIGGPADYFFQAESEEQLSAAAAFARTRRLPFYLVGGGYNLLFDDTGFRGLIIRNRCRGLRPTGGGRIEAASGTSLRELTDLCLREGVGGLEFLAGIPGTLGGAVYGNAGAFGRAVGEVMDKARLLTPEGEVRSAGPEDFDFSYRWSRLKSSGDLLLSASLLGTPDDPAGIARRVKENLAFREARHPRPGTSCAGSYFKNPVLPSGEKVPAARLLDQTGAKSRRVGGAAVYPGHANFIVNTGGAGSRDVLRLAEELKNRVEERFGVRLEEEVIYLPAEPSSRG